MYLAPFFLRLSPLRLIYSQWDQANIRGLGWSDKEELLVVAEDGIVRRYFGLDGEFTSFSLGNVSLIFQIKLPIYLLPLHDPLTASRAQKSMA